MRTREEIKKDTPVPTECTVPSLARQQNLIIELLIDIRDQNEKLIDLAEVI